MTFTALLIFSLSAFACAGSDASDYQTPVASPEGFVFGECEPMGTHFAVVVPAYGDDDRQELRAPFYHQSENYPSIWFISADVEGPGNRGVGPIATWWSYEPEDSSLFYFDSFAPHNDVAEQFSGVAYEYVGYRRPYVMGELPPDATGAELAEECVLEQLRQNPEEPTGVEIVHPGAWVYDHSDRVVLIVGIEPRLADCYVLPFNRGADGITYYSESYLYSLDFSVSHCAQNLITDESQIPSIDYESIPDEYRKFVDR